jgi:hypothetical protein
MDENEDKIRVLEANIISEAKAQLKQLHGITSVCLDTLKYHTYGTFEERVERLVCDTLYWEGNIK